MGFIKKLLKVDDSENYEIIGFVGSPGVGKSCVLQQLINDFYYKGITVWSNRAFQYALKIDIDDLKDYNFYYNNKQGGILILDELGIDMNNRNYKEIDKKILEFFKLYRHFKLNIYVISQGIDVDITVRRLINKWYILERKYLNLPFFKIKTRLVGLYEVENNLEIQNGDWKQVYYEGVRIATFDISKSFKQFNSFELPDDRVSKELNYWFPLPMTDEQLSKSVNSPQVKIKQVIERIRAKRGTGRFAREKVQPDYKNLTREQLLDEWQKSQKG